MLSQAETLDLVRRAQKDDDQAKEVLIERNSRLIKSVIRRYKNKGVEYEDLYQLGSLGFLKAITNFDETFNVKFTTYAVPMIAGEVKRYLRDNGFIKVSRSVKSLNIQINKFIESYISEQNKTPNIDTIANHFELTAQEIVFAMESNYHPLSLSTLVGEEDGDKQQLLIEKIPEKTMDNDLDLFVVMKVINTLPKRDKKIILLRYFRDKTQKEIAEILGVSQVQVSRLENKIIQTIKKSVTEKEAKK